MTGGRAPQSQLERELLEQGSVLARRAPIGAAAASDAATAISAAGVDYLLIAARGSSDNAARFAQYAFGAELRLTVALATPSLFADPETAPRLRGAAVLGISQSGQSPDIVGVLHAARRQGRPTIALTNDEGSPLAKEADVVVPLAVGAERSVAATKTYVASLHALLQLLDRCDPREERAAWLERLPELVADVVDELLGRRASFEPLHRAVTLTVVGRGLDFSTAHETALKIRELSGIVAEAFSPADLLHGPVAALGPQGALWIVDTLAERDHEIAGLLESVADRGIQTVLVSSRGAELTDAGLLEVLLPDGLPHWVASILAILPAQVAAMHLAEARGVDLDRPHGLSKVTLTS